jgi:hypothetical protein
VNEGEDCACKIHIAEPYSFHRKAARNEKWDTAMPCPTVRTHVDYFV